MWGLAVGESDGLADGRQVGATVGLGKEGAEDTGTREAAVGEGVCTEVDRHWFVEYCQKQHLYELHFAISSSVLQLPDGG
jgi:hypothetical protein